MVWRFGQRAPRLHPGGRWHHHGDRSSRCRYNVRFRHKRCRNYDRLLFGSFQSWLRARRQRCHHHNRCSGGWLASQGTFPISINNARVITGYYVDASSGHHAFVRSPSGAITSIDVPGALATYGGGANQPCWRYRGILPPLCAAAIFRVCRRSKPGHPR